jgi:hypothetical protein
MHPIIPQPELNPSRLLYVMDILLIFSLDTEYNVGLLEKAIPLNFLSGY